MEKIKVLAVDDRQENLIALEAALSHENIQLYTVTSGQKALALMLDIEFALVLMDVQMPEMDGFETAELMRRSEKTRHTPIIFLTAINKEHKHVSQGYQTGAVDYLFKPVDPAILRSKVHVFLELFRQKILLKENAEALKEANQQLIAQQKSKIEEERLKLLFQLAGATAHELNQPLMALLGNIELVKIMKGNCAADCQNLKHLENVDAASQRIAEVIRKIQTIQQDRVKQHDSNTVITDIHQIIRILCVEDDEIFFQKVKVLVEEKDYHAEMAASISEGITKLQASDYHLILLDYHLPDGNGIDFMDQMASAGIDLPVVVLTVTNDEVLAAKMIRKGAYEYLWKGDIKRDLLPRILHRALEKVALKRDLMAVQHRMANLAFTDELTGVFNRRYVFEELQREIAAFGRYQDDLSLCIIDLDHFKAVNDTHGHLAGDHVLSEIAKKMNKSLRGNDILGRYGGEEFIIIFPRTSLQEAEKVCNRCRLMIAEQPFVYNEAQIHVTISIGLSGFKENMTSETLVENADQALYSAKRGGRNKVVMARND